MTRIAGTPVRQPNAMDPAWAAERGRLLAETTRHCGTCHCPENAARCPHCGDMGGTFVVNPTKGRREPPALFVPCPNGCPVPTLIL